MYIFLCCWRMSNIFVFLTQSSLGFFQSSTIEKKVNHKSCGSSVSFISMWRQSSSESPSRVFLKESFAWTKQRPKLFIWGIIWVKWKSNTNLSLILRLEFCPDPSCTLSALSKVPVCFSVYQKPCLNKCLMGPVTVFCIIWGHYQLLYALFVHLNMLAAFC